MDISIKKDLASNWFKLLQNAICDDILKIEKNKVNFESTSWKRSNKRDEGCGEYRILKNGKIFEKVGVNVSKVYGKFPLFFSIFKMSSHIAFCNSLNQLLAKSFLIEISILY